MGSNIRSVQKLAHDLGMPPIAESAGLDALVPYLELMRAEGAVVVLKLDGKRGPGDSGPYTAVVTGGKLVDEYFHTDTDSLLNAASYVIVNYARACWGFAG